MACVDATNSRIEQNATPAAPATLPSPSLSGSPLTRLNILITASIAGDNGASGSSFPDINTLQKQNNTAQNKNAMPESGKKGTCRKKLIHGKTRGNNVMAAQN